MYDVRYTIYYLFDLEFIFSCAFIFNLIAIAENIAVSSLDSFNANSTSSILFLFTSNNSSNQ